MNPPLPLNNDNASLIKTVFPSTANTVFYSAIVLGLLFTASSFAVLMLFPEARLQLQSNLIMCTGLALVCAAFGSQATVNTGKMVIAGVGAAAIALFFVVEYRADVRADKKSYIRGDINEVKSSGFRTAGMQGNIDFMGQYNADQKYYTFAIFNDLSDSQIITLFVDLTKNGDGGNFAIHSSCLKKTQRRRRLNWKLIDYKYPDGDDIVPTRAIYDNTLKKVIAVYKGRGAYTICESPGKSKIDTRTSSIFEISSAFAQSTPKQSPPTDKDIKAAIKNLTNEDKYIRRDARKLLSQVKTADVPEIIKAMRSTDSSDSDAYYRRVLGGNVALTLMLRRDKSRADDISKVLTAEDLIFLAKTAAHKDRTMRIFATEFLYDLSDKRMPEIALPLAEKTDNAAAKYNWILSSQGGWKQLPEETRGKLNPTLENLIANSGLKTQKLLKAYSK